MARFLVFLVVVGLSLADSGRVLAGEKSLPADLAFVPADAVALVHVRLAEVWKSDFVKPLRQTALAAGDKLLAAFDERFFPRPSTLERMTVFVNAPEREGPGGGEPIVLIATSKPIDRAAFLKHTLPGATMEKTDQGTLVVHVKKNLEAYFVDDRTLAVGPRGIVRASLVRPKPAKGDMGAALQLARSGKPIVMALNTSALPPAVFKQAPPALQPLLKARLVTLTIDLGEEAQIDLRAAYASAEEAGEAETAAKEGIKTVRAFLGKARTEMEQKVMGNGKPASLDELPEAAAALFAVGLLNQVDDYLASVPVRKTGNDLHASLKLPKGVQSALGAGAIGAALLVPAVQKVREAAARTQSMNNLKQIVIALLNHESANRRFPAAAICDKAGKPLLSWRVAILPYIEQEQLYRQFKLDEPWDSEHNKKLIPLMPALYANPAAPARPGETYYRVFVGDGAGFDWSKGLSVADYTDGLSNTIAVVEAAESVPWTKPDELVYDAKKPLPKLGNLHGRGLFLAAFFDGSVRSLRNDLPEETLRALITRAGGEVVGVDD